MLREYSRSKSEILAQIHTTMAELQLYLMDCFLLVHIVHNETIEQN